MVQQFWNKALLFSILIALFLGLFFLLLHNGVHHQQASNLWAAPGVNVLLTTNLPAKQNASVYVQYQRGGTNYYSETHKLGWLFWGSYVGDSSYPTWARTYILFDPKTSLPSDATLLTATLILRPKDWPLAQTITNTARVGIYSVKVAWTEVMTWTSQPKGTEVVSFTSILMQKGSQGPYRLNLTKQAQDWFLSNVPNYGVMVAADPEFGGGGKVVSWGAQGHSNTWPDGPQLEVSYSVPATPTPTSTSTPTPTNTLTATSTPTQTNTPTLTYTPSVTPTQTRTPSQTRTHTPSYTPTHALTFTPSPSRVPTVTSSQTLPTIVWTATSTKTPSPSATVTGTPPTLTPTVTGTPPTLTSTNPPPTIIVTATPSPTNPPPTYVSVTVTPTPSNTPIIVLVTTLPGTITAVTATPTPSNTPRVITITTSPGTVVTATETSTSTPTTQVITVTITPSPSYRIIFIPGPIIAQEKIIDHP